MPSWSDVTVVPGEASLAALRRHWHWLLGERWTPLLFSAVGDVFVELPAGAVWWLSTATGSLEHVADSRDEFQSLLGGERADEWFLPGLVGVLREQQQQLVLDGREVDGLTCPRHLASREVQGELTEDQNLSRRSGVTAIGVAERDPHAREQLVHAEGLGEVVVGPGVQPRDAVFQPVERRQHQHGQRRLGGAHALEHGQAVDHGQPEVEHADVEMLLEQQELGHCAVGCHLDLEAGLGQAGAERIGQDQIVFGEQQLHASKLNGLTKN